MWYILKDGDGFFIVDRDERPDASLLAFPNAFETGLGATIMALMLFGDDDGDSDDA